MEWSDQEGAAECNSQAKWVTKRVLLSAISQVEWMTKRVLLSAIIQVEWVTKRVLHMSAISQLGVGDQVRVLLSALLAKWSG